MPRKIFTGAVEDDVAAVLGEMGQSYKCIYEHTGLKPGMTGYRLKYADIRVKDYRDGKTVVAKSMIKRAMARVQSGQDPGDEAIISSAVVEAEKAIAKAKAREAKQAKQLARVAKVGGVP